MSTLDNFSIVSFSWGREPPTVDELISIAQRTEDLGFHSFNLPLVNHPSSEGPFSTWDNLDTLDPLVVLPALVMATKKLRIIVDGIHLPTMPPFAWAKYFASLDVMSGGRIAVGMYVPRYDRVHLQCGGCSKEISRPNVRRAGRGHYTPMDRRPRDPQRRVLSVEGRLLASEANSKSAANLVGWRGQIHTTRGQTRDDPR